MKKVLYLVQKHRRVIKEFIFSLTAAQARGTRFHYGIVKRMPLPMNKAAITRNR
jgi:hypothetical protein